MVEYIFSLGNLDYQIDSLSSQFFFSMALSHVDPASVHKIISCCERRGLVFQHTVRVGGGNPPWYTAYHSTLVLRPNLPLSNLQNLYRLFLLYQFFISILL